MIDIDIRRDRFPVRIRDAEKHITQLCFANAARIYGSPLPEPVAGRLEEELESIVDFGFSTHFYIAWAIGDVSKQNGYSVRAGRQTGSSLVAYLLGISGCNPLPQHYYCPACHYYEEMDSVGKYDAVAFDFPDKKCPSCGEGLKKNGANAPYEIFAGARKNREPDIAICVAPEARQLVIERLVSIFGRKHVLQGSIIKDSDNGTKEVQADPSAVHILPSFISIDDVTSVISVEDETGRIINVSAEYDRYELDYPFTTLDIIPDQTLGMIHALEERTGCSQKAIPMEDVNTMRMFAKADTSGIPVFESAPARKLLSAAVKESKENNLSFSHLMKILALSNGVGYWKDDEFRKRSIAFGKAEDVICYRDEVFLFLLDRGLDVDEADYIVRKVRSGRVNRASSEIRNKQIRDALLDAGIDEDYIKRLEAIGYIQSKAGVLSEMEMYWKIAYYRVHFPKTLREVIR